MIFLALEHALASRFPITETPCVRQCVPWETLASFLAGHPSPLLLGIRGNKRSLYFLPSVTSAVCPLVRCR